MRDSSNQKPLYTEASRRVRELEQAIYVLKMVDGGITMLIRLAPTEE